MIPRRTLALAALLGLALPWLSPWARAAEDPPSAPEPDPQPIDGPRALPPFLVSPDLLNAKIAEAESDPELPGETKTRLIALYRRALGNLQEVEANRARADAFEAAARSAVERTARLRERAEAARSAAPPPDPAQDPALGPAVPRAQIERQLKKLQADQAAAEARRADLERQLAYQEDRPAAVRQRLLAAQDEQESIAATLQAGFAPDQGLTLVQAGRWALETRYVAIGNEIKSLDQELASLPQRLDLLEAQRDLESAALVRLDRRVESLQTLVNGRREDEAGQARAAALKMLQATAGTDPVLVDLAERNAALTGELNAIAARLDALDEERSQAERLAERIQSDFKREQAAEQAGGLDAGLGQLLLEHRSALPDFKVYARQGRELERQIAATNVSRLRHLDESGRFADLDLAVAGLAAQLPAAPTPQIESTLRALAAQRQDLLGKQLESEGHYLDLLGRLQTAQARMLESARAYDAFLEKHLFWLRTGASTSLSELGDLPRQIELLTGPASRARLAQALGEPLAGSAPFWLALLLAALLRWRRPALVAAIQASAARLDRSPTEGMGATLKALALTVAAAAPLPLAIGAAGWQLEVSSLGSELSRHLGYSLRRLAIALFVIQALRTACLPGGVALAHFRWPAGAVRRLGGELRWLAWIFVPAALIGRVSLDLSPVTSGGLVTRLAVLISTLAFARFLYRILHLKQGVLAQLRARPDAGPLLRAQPIWAGLLVAFPLLVLATALNGYVYSTLVLTTASVTTLWLVAALALLYGLGLRWLKLVRRRLAYRAVLERRQAAQAQTEPGPDGSDRQAQVAEPEYGEIDPDAVSKDLQGLLRIGLGLIAVLGLYLIWQPFLPALEVLDEIALWSRTATVDGEPRTLPVSLGDLLLALLYLAATFLIARRFPPVLDMVLLERFGVHPGGRYTATTLVTYAVVILGILLALHTIGAQWSQVQWLMAAVGLGIGFGLQEIVANFVSGLIILFERPVRVGDTITVGDTDGVVTKIRIRATTIRNWDRKELLVPNKELITGRLVNWSLSDSITRVNVAVGVAYGSDVDLAHALMREAALEHPHVLADPKPILTFEGFGDNSLTLTLRAFIDDLDYRIATVTDLHKAINRKFQEAGIAIAFPQRDLHIETREPLRVVLERPKAPPRPESGGNSELG